jgi:hypothetical protein
MSLDYWQLMDDPVITAILSSVLTALCTFLATLYAAVHPWRRKYEELVKSITYWVDYDYDVALDGIKSAGKSALVARWMNPTTDVTALGATSGIALHRPVQVCTHDFEGPDGTRHQHRYRLVIHDVGGEWRPQLGQVLIEKKIRAAILVIDPMELETSLERFSGGTLHMTYLTQNSLDNLICILIYISKCDLASEDQLVVAEQQVRYYGRGDLRVAGVSRGATRFCEILREAQEPHERL